MSTVITLARENIARLTEAPEFSFNWHISQKSRTDPATKEKRLLNKVLIEKRPKQGRVRLGSLTIPFDCENGRSEDLAYLVKLLHEKLQDAPHLDLKEALDRITGAKKDVTFDWPLLEADYHRHIQQKGLTEAAWKDFYGKAFYRLRDLMLLPAGRRPIHGKDLAAKFLEQWIESPSMQVKMRTKARYFVNWALDARRWPSEFDLPRKWDTIGPKHQKRDGYPLEDADILLLVDFLRLLADTTKHAGHSEQATKWCFAIQIMSVYGLRPEDLAWLQVRTSVDGVRSLWSNYPKTQGDHGYTEERELMPILVRDSEDRPVDWNLLERIASGEDYGGFKPKDAMRNRANGQIGKNLNRYLSRKQIWNDICKRVMEQNPKDKVTGYSFRHRWMKQGHRLIDHPDQSGILSGPGGHSVAVHEQNYNRFKRTGVKELFDAANQ